MELLAVVIVAVVLLATYLTWLSSRLERLHLREAAARRALDDQLARRAIACLRLAEERPSSAPRALTSAASASLRATPAAQAAAENDLVRLLRVTALDPEDAPAAEVLTACRRLRVARQVHTDAVRDACALLDQRVTRVFRLGAHCSRRAYFDSDEYDSPAAGPAADPASPSSAGEAVVTVDRISTGDTMA
jgi:hypothetical protein